MNRMPPLLAQAEVGRAIGWSLVLIALIVVAFLGVIYLRRWLQEEDVPGSAAIGFTLTDLKRLHREGKMTDEEFQRASEKMITAGKSMAQNLPDPLAGSRKRREESGQGGPS